MSMFVVLNYTSGQHSFLLSRVTYSTTKASLSPLTERH